MDVRDTFQLFNLITEPPTLEIKDLPRPRLMQNPVEVIWSAKRFAHKDGHPGAVQVLHHSFVLG